MHIGDSAGEAAFRATAAAWLAEHAPAHEALAHTAYGEGDDLRDHIHACRRWQAVLAEHGWAGITWPIAHGGRGGTPIEAAIFAEEQARYGVSNGAYAVAAGMVAPTLMAHGTDAQRRRFIDRIRTGADLWCQLFSEPGAGSDLASLGTRATLDGDEWVINGQKVWTSFGQFADWGILLARTHPDLPKHKGITYFLVDMRGPGIDVRPLRQINGSSHFNEVFLTDVRIPADQVVGEPGAGWRVAHTTLSNERALIGGVQGTWSADGMIELARRRGANGDPVIRQALAGVVTRARIIKFLGYRLRTAISQGRTPGPEALIVKLAVARHYAASTPVAAAIRGADALLCEGPDAEWGTELLSQYAVRIGGGTDEIQQNIIAEVALGLPREPSTDKDLPWSALRRA